ncbi:MAG TPA: molybdate ABC transporter substrate-binding protein [Bryobacteraceae bacterium]|nr:molybdate ABC transporter substrate-binding protein [Bryobacteraceae bacterium]
MILAALMAASCRSNTGAASPRVVVAAAANLTDAAQLLGREFEAQTKIHAVFSFASTAQLASQIENGAPFDVFLAADATHVDQLDEKHLLTPGSSAVYAQGILALWVPSRTDVIKKIEDLTHPDVQVIALAKPELAPYGEAAREALQQAGIWNAVQSKIVYAENVNGAKQYGVSRNADAALLPYSLVLKESGEVIQIPESQHRPIVQKLGIVAASPRLPEAQKFVDFVLHGGGQEIFQRNGYRPPIIGAQ